MNRPTRVALQLLRVVVAILAVLWIFSWLGIFLNFAEPGFFTANWLRLLLAFAVTIIPVWGYTKLTKILASQKSHVTEHANNVVRNWNGWVRLGVLVSAFWLFAVFTFTWFPSILPSIGGWLYRCELEGDPLCLFAELSYSRVVVLALAPVVIMCLLFLSIAWVMRGFRDS